MNHVILILTVFVVLVAAGAGVWFVVLQDQQDRELSARIDAMAPQGTPDGAPRAVNERPQVLVRLRRAEAGEPSRAHVVVEVESGLSVPLLVGWRGRQHESRERVAAHEGALARIREALHRRVAATGVAPAGVRAAIEADEALVATGEAVEILDLLIGLGLADVYVETR